MQVDIDKIIIPEERARSRWTAEQKEFLQAGMATYGQLSEVLVRPLSNGTYELIDGESRIHEMKESGASKIDVRLVELNDKDVNMVNILMNVARGEQDPMGIALVFGKAVKDGMNQDQIALATGKSRQWVQFMLMLNDLPQIYQEALARGDLKVTHIRQACRLPNAKEVDAALGAALQFGFNTSVLSNYVDNRLKEYMVAEAQRKRTGIEAPPAPPDPQKLVKYAQCLICGEMVENERLSLPRQCEACYAFSKYAVSQIGKGEEGMQNLYKALETQQSFEQSRRQFLMSEHLGTVSPPGNLNQSIQVEQKDSNPDVLVKPDHVTAEEWESIKKMIGSRDL